MSREKGFTLVEILIAMVVMSVGLLGILGVFPAGIRKTAEVVEDSYAAIIAESVRNAVELGLQQGRIDDGADKGFIYMGEGVEELLQEKGHTLPVDITTLDGNGPSINKAADYWIKLPYDQPDVYYLFPRFDPTNYEMGAKTVNNIEPVKRVFPCGAKLLKDSTDMGLSLAEREEALRDPYSQYSYAFVIREVDTGNPSSHSLYELTILVYRNFPSAAFKSGNEASGFADRQHKWIKKFKTYVSF